MPCGRNHFFYPLLKQASVIDLPSLRGTEVQSPGFEEFASSQSAHSELRWWHQRRQKSAAAAKHSGTLEAPLGPSAPWHPVPPKRGPAWFYLLVEPGLRVPAVLLSQAFLLSAHVVQQNREVHPGRRVHLHVHVAPAPALQSLYFLEGNVSVRGGQLMFHCNLGQVFKGGA